MKKIVVFAVALLVVGVVIGAGAVAAQDDPGKPGNTVAQCTAPAFDVDGNGLVSENDIQAWRDLAIQCVNRDAGGGFVPAEACRLILGDENFALADIDGDGDLDAEDTSLLGSRALQCTPKFTRLPRGG
jgi:hypothetical protein